MHAFFSVFRKLEQIIFVQLYCTYFIRNIFFFIYSCCVSTFDSGSTFNCVLQIFWCIYVTCNVAAYIVHMCLIYDPYIVLVCSIYESHVWCIYVTGKAKHMAAYMAQMCLIYDTYIVLVCSIYEHMQVSYMLPILHHVCGLHFACMFLIFHMCATCISAYEIHMP